MIKECIAKLVDGQVIDGEEARLVIRSIMQGECSDAQIAGFITALRMQGESPEVVAGAARAMREACTPVPTKRTGLVDTCGTGGDGAHTFNISTAAAFVAAGAGVPIAKHGNRSVSSRSGSADVLAALGVDISVGPEVMTRCLDEAGLAFLFAPTLHPAMKHAIGPRRELGIRTVFNILGPLTNPAGAKRQVLGVYSPALVSLVASALAELGTEHAFVVHGHDGLDEITLSGPTTIGEVTPDGISIYQVTPEELGMPRARHGALAGGDPAHNAAMIQAVLEGTRGPTRDVTVLNAAAAIRAGGHCPTLKAGLAIAETSIDSGAARARLDDLIRITRAN